MIVRDHLCPQMVILSDAHLIDSVIGRSTEIDKSVDIFYEQFNVVSRCKHLEFATFSESDVRHCRS